jgi:hypothetical protein
MAHRTSALLAAMGLAVGGCGLHGHHDAGHDEGPLVAQLGSGGVSLDAPHGKGHWSGTFGGLLLCTRNGAPVTVDSVDYDYGVEPVKTRALIRQVPDGSHRKGKPIRWAPIGSYRNSIEELRGHEVLSTSIEAAEGATFSMPCSKDMDAPFTELLTEMEVDARGGWIDRITIGYTSDGKSYDVSVSYSYSACGTAVAHEWFCDPDWDGGNAED